MIKAVMKLGIEGMYLIIIKAVYDKSIANIILNGENRNRFFQGHIQNKGVHSLHSYSI
jgi:hypothetical protein